MAKPVKIQLKSKVPDKQMLERKGTGISRDDMAIELHGDADVYMPNGKPLLMLRRAVVSEVSRDLAIEQFRWMKTKYVTDNRGSYSGYDVAGKGTIIRNDGQRSMQTRTMHEGKIVSISSAIIGYYGRSGRFPFCRQSAFTQNEPERWAKVMPLVEEVSEHFRQTLPARWQVQSDFADSVSQDFRIPNTVFSTLTINNNVSGTVHKDAGDFKDGFGVIGCFRRGSYLGGHLCFPQYKVFVDFHDRDLIYFNPHEWHGVNPIIEDDGDIGERITMVYYFRKNLCDCGTVPEELARVRHRFGDVDDPEANRAKEIK